MLFRRNYKQTAHLFFKMRFNYEYILPPSDNHEVQRKLMYFNECCLEIRWKTSHFCIFYFLLLIFFVCEEISNVWQNIPHIIKLNTSRFNFLFPVFDLLNHWRVFLYTTDMTRFSNLCSSCSVSNARKTNHQNSGVRRCIKSIFFCI